MQLCRAGSTVVVTSKYVHLVTPRIFALLHFTRLRDSPLYASQWLLQPGPRGKVALASLDDGRYLGTYYGEIHRTRVGMTLRDRPIIQSKAFHWVLDGVSNPGIYRYRTLCRPISKD